MFMFVTYATYFSNYRQRMSGVHVDSIELSRNKQSACVIVYKCPVICCQSQVRIERFNKEVSIKIITQNINFALSLTYLDKNDYMII